MKSDRVSPITRIAVFYDGTYFLNLSRYFKYQHPRLSYLTFTGLQEYFRDRVAECESRDVAFCQVVESHFFRGRYSLHLAKDKGVIESDRYIDELMMYAGVASHYYPLNESKSPPEEKGIDVWLALEAYDLALHKGFDVVVLISGDQDMVPLVRKLSGIGTRVMLVCGRAHWEYQGLAYSLRTSKRLINECPYVVVLNEEVDSKGESIPALNGIFQHSAGREGYYPGGSDADD